MKGGVGRRDHILRSTHSKRAIMSMKYTAIQIWVVTILVMS